jgi:hypothetical protein
MPNEEKMILEERRKDLRTQQKRDYASNRKERRQLLDEMGPMTGLHRKMLILSIAAPSMPVPAELVWPTGSCRKTRAVAATNSSRLCRFSTFFAFR